MNNNITISDAGSLLMGAGIAKLDNLYVGVGLILIGAVLKIVVAVLNKQGIEVQASNLG